MTEELTMKLIHEMPVDEYEFRLRSPKFRSQVDKLYAQAAEQDRLRKEETARKAEEAAIKAETAIHVSTPKVGVYYQNGQLLTFDVDNTLNAASREAAYFAKLVKEERSAVAASWDRSRQPEPAVSQ